MENRKIFFWFSLGIAFFSILYAFYVILGSVYNLFAYSNSILYPIKFNAAVCLIFLSLAIISLQFNLLWLSRLFSLFPIIFGLLSLGQDLSGMDFGIDDIFGAPLEGQTAPFRHLAPKASLGFILMGIAFFLNSLQKLAYAFFISIILLSVVISVSLVAIFGYSIRLDVYGWENNIRFQGAILFLLLGIQNGFFAWKKLNETGEKHLFPYLAFPFFIFVAIATIGLWQVFKYEENISFAQQNRSNVQDIKLSILRTLEGQVKALKKTSRQLAFKEKLGEKEWEDAALADIQFEPSIQSIDAINSNGLIQTSLTNKGVTSKLKGQPYLQQDLLNKAKNLKKDSFFQKNNELFLIGPIFKEDHFEGFLAINYDLKILLDTILKTVVDSNDAIKISSGKEILFLTQKSGFEKENSAEAHIQLDDLNWKIEAGTSYEKAFWRNSLSAFILLFGLLLASLVFSAVFLGVRARIRTLELENLVKELNKTQTRLIEQEKLASLGTVTAGIAHEIKNPLTFVNTFSDLSLRLLNELSNEIENQKEGFPIEKYQEVIETIETLKDNIKGINKHGLRATTIVQKMGSHGVNKKAEKSITDMHFLIEEYFNLAYRSFRSQEPDFLLITERDYRAKNSVIKVDPEGIGRVLINIFNNAFYAMMKKRKALGKSFHPELFITTKNAGNYFIIKIRDNGEGISKGSDEKLFTPFFSTKPPGEGTGLGLSLSHKIVVRDHEGKIEFNSKEGEFAEFIISLPFGGA